MYKEGKMGRKGPALSLVRTRHEKKAKIKELKEQLRMLEEQ